MEKLIFTVIASLQLFSCSQNDEIGVENPNKKSKVASSRLSFGENVKLIKVKDSRSLGCGSGANCTSAQTREYVVEVANLGLNKSVVVQQQLSNGQWEDFYLTYSFTTSVGTEIWKGTSNYVVGGSNTSITYVYGEQLSAKYVVNGQTYWDSNNGSNYRINNTNREPISSFLYLNQSFDIFQSKVSSSSFYSGFYINVSADVRNIAFAKEVKIVYTTDNWVTSNTSLLNFSTFDNFGGDPINSTTDFERWVATFAIPVTNKLVYALSYKVNGQTYWDNNFGTNYTLLLN